MNNIKTSPEDFFIIEKTDHVSPEVLGLLLERMRAISMLLQEPQNDFCQDILNCMNLDMIIQAQKLCGKMKLQESKS